jgi:membrane protein DedA with SNARE-associated domain
MSEDKEKSMRLFTFWIFGTVLIVFAAITAYIFLFTGGASIWEAVKAGFPMWGLTTLGAVIIYIIYYFYSKRQD